MALSVREAMLPNPPALDASLSAREAARALARPLVRCIYVTEDGRLVGEVTRDEIVALVARGEDPDQVRAAGLAVDVRSIESAASVDEAVQRMDALGVSRIPVVERGRLVGVLARQVLVQRLAEDEGERGSEGGSADR